MSEVKREYFPNGQIEFEEYRENGLRHRPIEQGPAAIGYYENGQIQWEIYYENDKWHRPVAHGPAYIEYYENGQIQHETYWENGKYHRPVVQGPADIAYYENGQIEEESYWENGKHHRPVEHGPAAIAYYENGQIQRKSYWENNDLLTGTGLENLIQTRKQQHQAAKVLQKNWKIALWNMKYRDLMTQVLCVPDNHDSLIGKLYPNGGHQFKKFKSLVHSF